MQMHKRLFGCECILCICIAFLHFMHFVMTRKCSFSERCLMHLHILIHRTWWKTCSNDQTKSIWNTSIWFDLISKSFQSNFILLTNSPAWRKHKYYSVSNRFVLFTGFSENIQHSINNYSRGFPAII